MQINAVSALKDPDSTFYYYQKLIQLRKSYSVFRDGDFQLLYPEDPELFVYAREDREDKMLVVCNFAPRQRDFSVPAEFADSRLLIANYPRQDGGLRPYEAFILYKKKGSER